MDAAGWMKPLDQVGARAKIEEVLESVIGAEAAKFSPVLNSSSGDNADQSEPTPKHADILEIDPTEAVMEEVCAIGAAASLEASPTVMEEACANGVAAAIDATQT